jgi:carbonic anhydrase
MDLEMHTVHLAHEVKNDFKYAAMGLMFDTKRYDHDGLTKEMVDTIDKFFDSLRWDITTGTPLVAQVPYGELMMLVDMNNRWVYSGSVTTPPCDTSVYWNVLRRVFPIKKKHLD